MRHKIPQFSESLPTVSAQTERTSSSVGIQAECGYFMDREVCQIKLVGFCLFDLCLKVLDSYLSLQMSECLADLKDKFVSMEQDMKELSEQKNKLEKMLEEKVQTIKVC